MDKILSDTAELDQLLCFALYSSSLAMTKVYRPILKKWNLTYSQYLVLLALWRNDGLTVSGLGEILFLDSGTLTPVLKRMETMKLLVRKRSLEDERQVIVTLTSKGVSLQEELSFLPTTVMKASAVPAPDMAPLIKRLNKIRAALLNFQSAIEEAGA